MVGRQYSIYEMNTSFDQFIAETVKQYCLEANNLRTHIATLPSDIHTSYQIIYDFIKQIYDGKEF